MEGRKEGRKDGRKEFKEGRGKEGRQVGRKFLSYPLYGTGLLGGERGQSNLNRREGVGYWVTPVESSSLNLLSGRDWSTGGGLLGDPCREFQSNPLHSRRRLVHRRQERLLGDPCREFQSDPLDGRRLVHLQEREGDGGGGEGRGRGHRLTRGGSQDHTPAATTKRTLFFHFLSKLQ